MKRVLITGAAGYIGSVLSRLLLKNGYEVVGFDNLSFGGESLLELSEHPSFNFFNGDIRNESDITKALSSCNSVVHLAAIVGDPACSKEPELAEEVNWQGSKLLFDICARNKVERFIFASTCSNYGQVPCETFAQETSTLNPVSHYARLKVRFEEHLLAQANNSTLIPTVLRFATVYGISPRMRFDLTVNDFTREALLRKRLEIFGAKFWRPYCHVQDLARGCLAVLEAHEEKVRSQVFGVGDTSENYQKQMIVGEILKLLPEVEVRYVEIANDIRDYRVDFSKISRTLGFKISQRVPDGIKEIIRLLNSGLLNDPFAVQYSNV